MSTKFFVDLLERVVFTFVAAFGGSAAVLQTVNGKTLGAAAAAAGITTVKAIVAGRVGDKNSAALLPSAIGGASGAAAGAAVGSAVGTTVGTVVEDVGKAVGDILDPNAGKGA